MQEEVNLVAEEESNVETAEVEEIVENIVDETTSTSESNDESAPEIKDEESKEG